MTCMHSAPHLRRVSIEGRHARHKLIENGPQAPPVHLMPMPCAQQQLRGQVVRGAHSPPPLMAGGPHRLLALLRPAGRGVQAISTRNQPGPCLAGGLQDQAACLAGRAARACLSHQQSHPCLHSGNWSPPGHMEASARRSAYSGRRRLAPRKGLLRLKAHATPDVVCCKAQAAPAQALLRGCQPGSTGQS